MTDREEHAPEDSAAPQAKAMTDPALITQSDVQEVFNVALRRRVGRGPGKIAVDNLSDAIGVDARTVKGWMDGPNVPYGAHMYRLGCFFGPSFGNELHSVIGQGGLKWLEPTNVDPYGTLADISVLGASMAERLRDGVFCHRDRAMTAPELRELAHTLMEQADAMDRAK